MLVHHRFGPFQALILIIAFHVVGCTHDKVTATSGTQNLPAQAAPNVTTPAETVATPPTTPEIITPAEPVAANTAEPVVTLPSETKANDTLTLKPGQSGTVDASTTLHYVRMVNDSRCPAGAQCIWAGEVTIELILDTGQEKQTFTLKDDEKAASILGYEIKLISIDRSHLINVQMKKN